MNRSPAGTLALLVLAFGAGFLAHVLYLRWTPALPSSADLPRTDFAAADTPGFSVTFIPSMPPSPSQITPASTAELPLVVARDLEKLRSLVGQQARVRGRVFRVGHSAKSNTYFINFGPSREALTAVIFNSGAELFEKNNQQPRLFENREVEIVGQVKEHPQYGIEVIIEHPRQIKILN